MLQIFSFLKNNKWKSLLGFLSITLLIALPIFLQYSLQQILLKQTADQGIDRVEIKDIDFNPFLANLSIEKLRLYRQNEVYAQLDYAEVQISLLALLRQQLLIETLHLSHGQLPIQLEAKQVTIAGFTLPLVSEETTEQAPSSLQLSIGIEEITFEAISIELEKIEKQQTKGKTNYDIRLLTINEEADFHRLQLQSQLNQSDLDANLQLHLFDEEPKVVGTFDLNHFDLSQLAYLTDQFAPNVSHYLNGVLSNNLTFTLKQTEQGIRYYQQGLIQFERFALKLDKLDSAFKQFNWKGDFHFIQNPAGKTDTQAIHLKGESKLTGLTVKEETQKISLSQDLVSQLNLDMLINPQGLNLSQSGQLTLNNINASQAPYNLQAQKLNWQGKLDLDLPTAESNESSAEMQLGVSGLVKLNDLNLAQQKTEQAAQLELLNLKDLSVAKFSISQLTDIQLSDIQLKQLSLIQAEQNKQSKQSKDSPLVFLQKLTLEQAQLKAVDSKSINLIELGALKLQNSQTNLVFNKQGEIDLINQLKQSLATTSATEAPESSAAKMSTDKVSSEKSSADRAAATPFNYRLQSLDFSGDNHILVKTNRDDLPLNKTFNLNKLTLGTIDSQAPKANTPYEVKIVFDEFSTVNSKGQFQALNSNLNLKAKTKIESLSLLELSAFAEEFIGYQVQSGQVSATLDTSIKNNKLNAKNDLRINQLEISSTDNKGQAFKKQLNMPLEAGISLLKDRRDNIRLKLPIKGDLNDLNFDLNNVITTALNGALLKGTKTYLLLALQPFGAILMAGEFAADQLTSVKLQMITYNPGLSSLTPEMQNYLGKINKLLNERRGIQIKLCGGTKESDRPELKQIMIENAKKAIQIATEADNDQEIEAAEQALENIEDSEISDEQLFTLAQERKNVIKRKLIELGSSANQIILCQPTLQSSEGKPSVEVGI